MTYTNAESPCCTPETNITALHVSYTSVKKAKNKHEAGVEPPLPQVAFATPAYWDGTVNILALDGSAAAYPVVLKVLDVSAAQCCPFQIGNNQYFTLHDRFEDEMVS